jgi:hypothetical protein
MEDLSRASESRTKFIRLLCFAVSRRADTVSEETLLSKPEYRNFLVPRDGNPYVQNDPSKVVILSFKSEARREDIQWICENLTREILDLMVENGYYIACAAPVEITPLKEITKSWTLSSWDGEEKRTICIDETTYETVVFKSHSVCEIDEVRFGYTVDKTLDRDSGTNKFHYYSEGEPQIQRSIYYTTEANEDIEGVIYFCSGGCGCTVEEQEEQDEQEEQEKNDDGAESESSISNSDSSLSDQSVGHDPHYHVCYNKNHYGRVARCSDCDFERDFPTYDRISIRESRGIVNRNSYGEDGFLKEAFPFRGFNSWYGKRECFRIHRIDRNASRIKYYIEAYFDGMQFPSEGVLSIDIAELKVRSMKWDDDEYMKEFPPSTFVHLFYNKGTIAC